MMKICFILANTFYKVKGGAELQALLIAKHLAKRGHEVHYIHQNEGLDDGEKERIQWHGLPNRTRRFSATFLNYLRLKSILDEIEPDIIYQRVRNPYTGLGAFYCKRRSTKFVWAVSSDRDCKKEFYRAGISGFPFYSNWKISEYGIKKADTRIAQTEHQKSMLKKNFSLDSTVIPNSHVVPDGLFEKKQPPLIVWIANIKPLKRPEKFIKLASEISDANFIMVGRPNQKDSMYQNKIEDKIEEVSNLEYKGEVPFSETNRLLRKASAFVNTSLPEEGFPNTYIQSWLRETPVLTLSFDPDNIIERKKLGYKVKNFETLKEKLGHILKDSRVRKEMGKRARRYAKKTHDIEKNISLIERRFKKLVNG